MEYLVFRLYGPLASWGEIAVGESRHTAAYPSKSALLGLLAAALGLRRSDEELQITLSETYRFAVKVISTGYLLRDYHTTQVPDSVGKFIYRTRRDELVIGKPRLGTILSGREYRCDALAIVAVKGLDGASWTLKELQAALLRPKYHLYLGRKSCPLAAPLNPKLEPADGFGQALDNYSHGALYISDFLLRQAQSEISDRSHAGPWIDRSSSAAKVSREDRDALAIGREPVRYYWEGDAGDMQPQQILTRHDQPISRTRWQFSPRAEQLLIREEED